MPQNIGRFEIRRELGRGSQSIVYLAWDPQLQREVAIKTLHFGKAEKDQNAALVAEARMVSKLRHPNVVPIFDVGEQDGDPYLVFEYVEGRSLAQAIKEEGGRPAIRAADLMRQVGDALAQAHALGIIHRDLKPSNILIDARGTPRVMDFGIATRVTDDAGAREKGLAGTPLYMAPEYVTQKKVSERIDVFAAGLILIELITGQRVIKGDTVERILYQIACEPVRLPKEARIDDRLSDILLKACAADPEKRYRSALEFKEALEGWLGAGGGAELAVAKDGEDRKQAAFEFLLRRMRHKTDFPALSDSVSAINKLTASEKESINKLSNTILKDYALTNKILRMVNSAYYRQAGGGNISTVSRAVIVLGFDAVRNIAITVLLFEHLENKGNAKDLKESFLRANLSGLLARDASQKFMAREAEEAYICSLFHRLGQLLAQYYFAEEFEEVLKLMQTRKLTENAAAAQVLGLTFEEIGINVARNWGFPESIVTAMHRLPEGKVRKPATMEQQLHVVAGFANEVCDMIASSTPETRNKGLHTVLDRFSGSMLISDKQIRETVEGSYAELAELAQVLRVNLKQSPFARQVQAFTGKTEAAGAGAGAGSTTGLGTGIDETVLGDVLPPEIEKDESDGGTPDDAQAVLTAGIQDISNSLVDDFSLNDLLRIILETMYRAMGFQRVLLCLKDVKTGMMIGRFGFGPDTSDVAKRVRFPVAFESDVFHLAMHKAVDIIITDIDDPKIADRIPAWYREKMSARTFVLFPLTIKGNPVALIYCDRDKAGSIRIPEKELTLLKTLRNQALLAIKQAT